VYRLRTPNDEDRSPSIDAHGTLVGQVRLLPAGVSFGSAIPSVEIERDPLTIVVNARGTGPFLLAWGSRAADADTSLPVASLIPGYTDQTPFALTIAAPAARRELGGPSRLTDLAPADRAERWQTALVWVFLVAGVLALALLAWKVAKGV
jgi:hypothetical protein